MKLYLLEKLKSLQGKSFFPLDAVERRAASRKERMSAIYGKPPYSNRWGDKIHDPDVSWHDYYEMREKDPTLPKRDPRVNLITLAPWHKWLYFSDDYGSFAERKKRGMSEEVLARVYPGFYPDKMDTLSQAVDDVMYPAAKRSIISKILWALAGI